MKLGKFLSVFEPITYIVIWEKGDNEEPVYTGLIFNMPFGMREYELVGIYETEDYDGAIISKDLDGSDNPNPKYNHNPGLVLCVKD